MTVGEGESGTLLVYAIIDSDRFPKRWRIHLETDDTTIDRPVDAGNRYSYPRALAGSDVNGDGEGEWLIKATDLASHGTNWQRLELFSLDDGRVRPLMVDGEIFWVNVGGTSRMGEGARCDGNRFVLVRAWALDRLNTKWGFSERFYEIDGTQATLLDRRTGSIRLSDYNDPILDPYYRITCGDYLYP